MLSIFVINNHFYLKKFTGTSYFRVSFGGDKYIYQANSKTDK